MRDDNGQVNFDIDLRVLLDWVSPPKDTQEEFMRQQMKVTIDAAAARFINDNLNKQNLMNRILGNTNIVIGPNWPGKE